MTTARRAEPQYRTEVPSVSNASENEPRKGKKLLPRDVVGYVVSISKKTRFRRLHHLGSCHRVPGVHYHEFEQLGVSQPTETCYDDVCQNCMDTLERQAGASSSAAEAREALSDPEASEEDADHSSSTELD